MCCWDAAFTTWGRNMKNITITLDEAMAIWLREHAAKNGVSVSRFVGDLVHERMRERREYDEAMRRFLAQKPFHFEWADGHRPTREEIHDRARADMARESSSSKETR
jgi:hypothetical protein